MIMIDPKRCNMPSEQTPMNVIEIIIDKGIGPSV